MNKFIFIAVFTVSGLVFVSCSADTEALENASQEQKILVSPKQNDRSFSREGDSVTTLTKPDLPEGPGDDPVLIPLPPKP